MKTNLQCIFKLYLFLSNNGSVLIKNILHSIIPSKRVGVAAHLQGRDVHIFYEKCKSCSWFHQPSLQDIDRMRLNLVYICFQFHQLLRISRCCQCFLGYLLKFTAQPTEKSSRWRTLWNTSKFSHKKTSSTEYWLSWDFTSQSTEEISHFRDALPCQLLHTELKTLSLTQQKEK